MKTPTALSDAIMPVPVIIIALMMNIRRLVFEGSAIVKMKTDESRVIDTEDETGCKQVKNNRHKYPKSISNVWKRSLLVLFVTYSTSFRSYLPPGIPGSYTILYTRLPVNDYVLSDS